MSLRDYLNGRLSGLDQDIEQGGLDEYGLGDLPADSFSTALLHFAEQSPMETADALAPIVTRLSPVPFEPGDLPDSPEAEAILADGGDVFDLLDELAPADSSLGSLYDDADPSAFDDELDDFDDELEDALESAGLDVEDDDEDERFDTDDEDDADDDELGTDQADPDDETDDLLDEDDDLDGNGAYGGGEELDREDDDEDDEDDRPDTLADDVDEDGFDDLEELGDFERIEHDLGPEQLHPVDEGAYDDVAEPDEGDDPAEIGFDLD